MREFTIRCEANEADRAFIRKMNARLTSVIDAPTHSRDEVIGFQDRFTASAWADDVVDGAIFVAVNEDGVRLGYINVREGMDEIANAKCGYIALLAVVAEAEGSGVGQALIHAAEHWAREMGFHRIALDVFASNRHAQHFYDRGGFRAETIRLIKHL